MKNKKAITLTLIGLFIFLFSIIGLTYAYWQITRTQSDENLVYTDCLKLDVTWGEKGFSLTDAYPMTNEELVNDFFPTQTPYHFTITNSCSNEVPVSINMESLTSSVLKDEYVDVILWEDNNTDIFNSDEDTVLSYHLSEGESRYRLIDNKVNASMIAENAKAAYQLYKFNLGANTTKQFNLLLFMDYDTPVDGTVVNGEEVHTNNVSWNGKITLNNYEIPKVKIGGRDIELVEEGDGLYAVEHIKNEENPIEDGFYNTEYRYAGANPNNYVSFGEVAKEDRYELILCLQGMCANLNIMPNFGVEEFYPDSVSCETKKIDEGLVSQIEQMASGDEYTLECKKTVSAGDDINLWRIIGLVNVKTSSGDIEQRLKIIRNDIIGNFAWDHKTSGTGSSTDDNGSNDWTDSQLMQMLNGIYYNADEGECWIDDGNLSSLKTTCKFDGTDRKTNYSKGLNESARNMIDTEISWNIGGWDTSYVTASEMYGYERGTTVYYSNEYDVLPWPRATEWNSKNTKTPGQSKDETAPLLFHSIALMYPSDYGYAAGGTCLESRLSEFGSNGCYANDWLHLNEYEVLLSPDSSRAIGIYVITDWYIDLYREYLTSRPGAVRPVTYLKSNVKIVNDGSDGSYAKPFILTME